ncbi:cullin-4A [Trichonephila clavipes]|nr:cullin-4A [Trichonephila clavipes]
MLNMLLESAKKVDAQSKCASPLVRLLEGEERWEVPDHPQGQDLPPLPLKWGETKLNCSVTCMVLKATVNDTHHLAICHDEFRGP